VAHFAKASTTKGTKVHKGKAVEFKTFVALCVLCGSGFWGRIVKVSHYQNESGVADFPPLCYFEWFPVPYLLSSWGET